MSDQVPDNRIRIRPAGPPPGAALPRPPAARRRRDLRTPLEDHPILAPVVGVALAAVCLYLTLFTPLLRTWILGPHPDRAVLGTYNTGNGWIIAGAFGLLFFSLLFLVIQGAEAGIRRLGRPRATCPRCGAAEARRRPAFPRVPVEGTDWAEATCPQCGHTWYVRH